MTTAAHVAEAAPTTVGELMARVRERCEIGRLALGPCQIKVQIERPSLPDALPTKAVILMLNDKMLVITSQSASGSLVKILDDGSNLWCNPAGAMSAADMRRTLDLLTLGFDCDRLADPLGLTPDTPVVEEESEGAYYYRLDPPSDALRWIDVEDFTLAEAWTGHDGDDDVRDVYNIWTEMGAGAWYPELMERWSGGQLVMRVKIVSLFPAPDLSPAVFTLENFYATDPPELDDEDDVESWEAPEHDGE